jgi:hypothetical protein
MPALNNPSVIATSNIGNRPYAKRWGVRTSNDEQSAAALPFRTQAGISDRVRTSNCYRGTGDCQKQCDETECSRPSPDEFHDKSLPRSGVQYTSTDTLYMRPDIHRSKL